MRRSNHEYFPIQGNPKKAKGNILLIPGLLGEKTFGRVVIPALNDEGYNVMEVDHDRRLLFNVNKSRSISIRRAAEEMVEESGKKKMHLVAHSKGADDSVSLMEWMIKAPASKVRFRIDGYAAIAGVGRNGRNPGIGDVRREFAQHRDEIGDRGSDSRKVFWKSVTNIAPNPALALAEAIAASRADTNEAMQQIVTSGVISIEYEAYGDTDLLVPAPTDRSDFHIYSGHHMTPVYEPHVILDAVHVLETH